MEYIFYWSALNKVNLAQVKIVKTLDYVLINVKNISFPYMPRSERM